MLTFLCLNLPSNSLFIFEDLLALLSDFFFVRMHCFWPRGDDPWILTRFLGPLFPVQDFVPQYSTTVLSLQQLSEWLRSPWGPVFGNIRLLLSVYRGPHPFGLPVQTPTTMSHALPLILISVNSQLDLHQSSGGALCTSTGHWHRRPSACLLCPSLWNSPYHSIPTLSHRSPSPPTTWHAQGSILFTFHAACISTAVLKMGPWWRMKPTHWLEQL